MRITMTNSVLITLIFTLAAPLAVYATSFRCFQNYYNNHRPDMSYRTKIDTKIAFPFAWYYRVVSNKESDLKELKAQGAKCGCTVYPISSGGGNLFYLPLTCSVIS